jgi:hypothetical protein
MSPLTDGCLLHLDLVVLFSSANPLIAVTS